MIISMRMRWALLEAYIGAKRNAYGILVGRPKGKRPLGKYRYRWVNKMEMDLRNAGWVWTGLIWLRVGTSEGLL
jgi:hypothetical protein